MMEPADETRGFDPIIKRLRKQMEEDCAETINCIKNLEDQMAEKVGGIGVCRSHECVG